MPVNSANISDHSIIRGSAGGGSAASPTPASQPIQFANSTLHQVVIGLTVSVLTAAGLGLTALATLSKTTRENDLILWPFILNTLIAAISMGIIAAKGYLVCRVFKNKSVFFDCKEDDRTCSRIAWVFVSIFMSAVASLSLSLPYYSIENDNHDPIVQKTLDEYFPWAVAFELGNVLIGCSGMSALGVAPTGLRIIPRTDNVEAAHLLPDKEAEKAYGLKEGIMRP